MSAEGVPPPGRPAPTGTTRVACVVGDPITHSLSPAIHNAAFAALDLDWVYTAFSTSDGGAAVDAMRALGIAGMSVTMPCKESAAAACDELTSEAAALCAANALVLRDDSTVVGHSTDGEGLLGSLDDEGIEIAGVRTLVLGAGGAARAAARALAGGGAEVAVAARRPDTVAVVVDTAGVGSCGATAAEWGNLAEEAGAAGMIVNATPIGMHGEEPPFPVSVLTDRHVVVDLVYDPPETPLMAAARGAGATTVGGLGMLLHQAAAAFHLWTGLEPPLPAMRRVVDNAG